VDHVVAVMREKEAILEGYRNTIARQKEKAQVGSTAPTSTRQELQHARLRDEIQARLQRVGGDVEKLFGEYERHAASDSEEDQAWCEVFEGYAVLHAEFPDEVEPYIQDYKRKRLYDRAPADKKRAMDSVERLEQQYADAQQILSGQYGHDGELDYVHRSKEGWVPNAVSDWALA
jgi:hypothetical protein